MLELSNLSLSAFSLPANLVIDLKKDSVGVEGVVVAGDRDFGDLAWLPDEDDLFGEALLEEVEKESDRARLSSLRLLRGAFLT
jgi:hypothetical protein